MTARSARRSARSVDRAVDKAVGTAVRSGGSTAGTAATTAGTALQRAGAVLETSSASAAPAVGAAVGTAVGTAVDTLADVAEQVADTVGGFLEEPAVRGGAALDALLGRRVTPPVAARRWPWALGAALLGAAAGTAVGLLLQRLQRVDAPGAQEPHELRAVVDLPPDRTPAAVAVEVDPQDAPVPPPA